MAVRKHRKYSKEFKEDVLNMLKTGDKTVMDLSRELGIYHNIIYRWHSKSLINTEENPGKVSDQEKELRELRAKLADVTEERDILKKAISIFSKQEPSK